MGAAAQLDSTPEAGISHTPDGPPSRRGGRRGGKAGILDQRGRLERSRQSARECRARKKLRYQYLEDLVKNKENAVFALRKELDQVTSSFILPKPWLPLKTFLSCIQFFLISILCNQDVPFHRGNQCFLKE